MASSIIRLDKYLKLLDTASTVKVKGRVIELTGLIIKASVPGVRVGETCHIESYNRVSPLKAEVVGFKGDNVMLMPLGDFAGIGPDSQVIPTGKPFSIKIGEQLLGHVLDGLGQPLDISEEEFESYDLDTYSVNADPPDPLKRRRILDYLSIGIRAIDGLLTVGEGQRMGLFAAAGVGKSTTMGMIARNTEAEVNVISLIGERGREVRDFMEESLGEEGLKKSIVVVATSDKPSLVRLKSAFVATAIAEYFRDKGKKVMLMMDSVTRFARAQREVGLALGEPPARQGYPPSVFYMLPKLLERTGNSDRGSITAFYTVLVAGDDMTEPIADEVRSILDGHIILSREMASRNHYPAIDVLKSVSRVMTAIVDKEHIDFAGRMRDLLATYEKQKDLILIGAYKKGSDSKVDKSIEMVDRINEFLKQGLYEKCYIDETISKLKEMFS